MKPEFLNRLPPRGRKWLLRLSLAFAAYSLIGFFLLPPIIKWQMVKRLPGHHEAPGRRPAGEGEPVDAFA